MHKSTFIFLNASEIPLAPLTAALVAKERAIGSRLSNGGISFVIRQDESLTQSTVLQDRPTALVNSQRTIELESVFPQSPSGDFQRVYTAVIYTSTHSDSMPCMDT